MKKESRCVGPSYGRATPNHTSPSPSMGAQEAARRLLEIDDTGLVKEDDVILVAHAYLLAAEEGERLKAMSAEMAPIVPPDDDAIQWARRLDAAATRHDQARTADEREKAAMGINCLILDDERMVQMARALLARLPAEEK